MNVLSIFDGMSCAQIALKRAGIPVTNYYASEIDKYAMQVTMANFPETIQLGSVVNVDVSKLPPIDFLCGGSPCQSFSFAGKRKGMATKCNTEITTLQHYLELKSDGFEFEGQSYLFWEYMRILTDIRKYNPNVKFLLENVEMGKRWERILTNAIGVPGIHINSALVSAQNRQRIYWVNWGLEAAGLFGDMGSAIPQPEDKGILLKDILETNVDEKYYLSDKAIKSFYTHTARMKERGNGFEFAPTDGNNKGKSLTTRNGSRPDDNFIKEPSSGGNHSDMDLILERGQNLVVFGDGYEQDNKAYFEDGKSGTLDIKAGRQKVIQLNPSLESGGKQPYQQNRVYDSEGIAPALCRDKFDLLIREATKKGYAEIEPGECFDMEQPGSATRRGRKMSVKSNTLMAKKTDFMQYTQDYRIRRLTPTECERLQTVTDGYTNHVSDTQRYKMLGNGWTVDTIVHLLKYTTK